MRKSAVSISSNIAEGFERGSRKEFIHFLYIAKGSAGELRSQLSIALELGYFDENVSKELRTPLIGISEQLAALIMSLKKSVVK
jgi:four helix bundle protein